MMIGVHVIAWLIRGLSSRKSSHLADRAVNLLGDRGLERYLTIVDASIPGNGAVSSVLRTTLANLPSQGESVLTTYAGRTTFIYGTSATDELRLSSRRDFEDWEAVSRWFFALLAERSFRILDIGAYSGVYALTAAKANPVAEVTAFEPNPEMFELVRQNVARNGLEGAVRLLPVALSSTSGVAHLYFETDDSSRASLLGEGDRRVEVQQETLDLLMKDTPVVDLIKIDVEGSEPAVFLGARDLLSRCLPTILAEALTPGELAEQADVLLPLGYVNPIAVDPDRVDGDGRNFVWFAPERQPEVEEALRAARTQVSQWPRSRRARRKRRSVPSA